LSARVGTARSGRSGRGPCYRSVVTGTCRRIPRQPNPNGAPLRAPSRWVRSASPPLVGGGPTPGAGGVARQVAGGLERPALNASRQRSGSAPPSASLPIGGAGRRDKGRNCRRGRSRGRVTAAERRLACLERRGDAMKTNSSGKKHGNTRTLRGPLLTLLPFVLLGCPSSDEGDGGGVGERETPKPTACVYKMRLRRACASSDSSNQDAIVNQCSDSACRPRRAGPVRPLRAVRRPLRGLPRLQIFDLFRRLRERVQRGRRTRRRGRRRLRRARRLLS
jgi:hypothetical protein